MKSHMQVCGVDEAGRGSMLGPLVIAGISISKSKVNLLKKQGIRDSKKLSPRARERLYKKIINIVDDYYVVKIPPRIIDKSVSNHSLNHLEAKYMAKVISKLHHQPHLWIHVTSIPKDLEKRFQAYLKHKDKIISSC